MIGLIGTVAIRFYDNRSTAKSRDVLLDTVVTLEITGKGDTEAVADGALELIRSLDAQLSMYREGSAVYEINKEAGERPVRVTREVFKLIRAAKEIASLSDGAFDPTIGPITRLWGISGSNRSMDALPGKAAIEEALMFVGFDKIIQTEPDVVYLLQKGAALDLGAIAKGYVSQRVADYLRSRGVESALIDLGGNVQLVGSRPNGKPWRIGIQDPRKERGEALCALELSDTSAITAGRYERFAEFGGERYAHIFDPRTGYPIRSALSSVTVVAADGTEGDALSTALMVMGPGPDALELLSLFPGSEAVFISEGRGGVPDVLATRGLEGKITSLDSSVRVNFMESP